METFGGIQPLNSTQSPIFVTTRPNAVPYIKTPQRLIKSMKTLQTESTKKPLSLFYPKQYKLTEEEKSQIYEEYVQINREIALLECELIPLREKCMNLRQQILSFQNLYFDSNNNNIDLFQPPNFTSAFIEIQNERDQLTQELDEMLEYYSNQSIQKMKTEIEQGIHFCELLSNSNAIFKQQSDQIHSDIENYRQSQFYQSIQNQRQKIIDLTQDLEDAKHRHRALKAEHFRLTDPVLQKEEKNVNEADSVIKLQRKLKALNYRQISLSDQYIQLREKQMKEIKTMTSVIQKEDSLKEIPFLQNQNASLNEGRSHSSYFVLNDKEAPSKKPETKESYVIKPTSSTPHIPGIDEINQEKENENYNSILIQSFTKSNET
ncbi:hypothetical protein M9Y10_043680 [Tritrichomonas musculus]|uniref:Uncharacterized protein n=1 Tax=Tritrichomonas musculus TaxID=1915356 RepID=A0ABR2K0R4_9EUKA